MNSVCFNGKIIADTEPVFLASNRSYRYGDGLFETMKVIKGRIVLSNLHFERLFDGLSLLKFEVPVLLTAAKLEQDILHLCKKNGCEQLARVRLSVFRGNGGLYDDDRSLQYLVECWPLNDTVLRLNENGLVIDIFPDAAKSNDSFSNLKSACFLPYTMAAIYAKENKLNDCLVLNVNGGIADSTIANLFVISNNTIITPSLEEACVSGVMRKYLISSLKEAGYALEETTVSLTDLLKADEVFLTNAINGIKWVRQFRNKQYSNFKTAEIYQRFVKTFFA